MIKNKFVLIVEFETEHPNAYNVSEKGLKDFISDLKYYISGDSELIANSKTRYMLCDIKNVKITVGDNVAERRN